MQMLVNYVDIRQAAEKLKCTLNNIIYFQQKMA